MSPMKSSPRVRARETQPCFGKDSYAISGSGLIIVGLMLFFAAYIILRSTPLAALGISTLILGITTIALADPKKRMPYETSKILFESNIDNVSALLEELGLNSKAIYLPSSMTQGKPRTLIPLHMSPQIPRINSSLSKRLVVRYGPDPDDMGLLITTLGSTIVSTMKIKPDDAPGKLEATLSTVFTSIVEIADNAKVDVIGQKILVEVMNPRQGDNNQNIQIYDCIGSPLASIVSSIAAEVYDRPIVVEGERQQKGKSIIELRIVDRVLEKL